MTAEDYFLIWLTVTTINIFSIPRLCFKGISAITTFIVVFGPIINIIFLLFSIWKLSILLTNLIFNVTKPKNIKKFLKTFPKEFINAFK